MAIGHWLTWWSFKIWPLTTSQCQPCLRPVARLFLVLASSCRAMKSLKTGFVSGKFNFTSWLCHQHWSPRHTRGLTITHNCSNTVIFHEKKCCLWKAELNDHWDLPIIIRHSQCLFVWSTEAALQCHPINQFCIKDMIKPGDSKLQSNAEKTKCWNMASSLLYLFSHNASTSKKTLLSSVNFLQDKPAYLTVMLAFGISCKSISQAFLCST